MIDELPLVGLLGALAARDHGRARRGRAAGQGERPHRLGRAPPCARWACAPRSARTASRCTGTGRLPGGDVESGGRPPAGDAGRGGGPRERGRASRSQGFEAVGVSYPGFARDLAALGAVAGVIVAIDGPAGRGQEHGGPRAWPGGWAWPTSTPARCTAASPGSRRERGVDPGDGPALAAPRAGRADAPSSPRATATGSRRRPGRDRRHPRSPRSTPAGLGGLRPSGPCATQMVAAQRALLARGAWVSDGRDVGSVVVPRRRAEGLPDRLAWRSAPAAAAPSWPRRGVEMERGGGARGRAPPRPPRHAPARTAPCGGRRGAVVIDSSELERRRRGRPHRAAWSRARAGARRDARDRPRQSRPRDHAGGWWAAGHAPPGRPFVRGVCRLRGAGQEHIPPTGPVLIVSNHISSADPPIARRRRASRGRSTTWRRPSSSESPCSDAPSPPRRLPGGARGRRPAGAPPGARGAGPRRRAADVPRGDRRHRRPPAPGPFPGAGSLGARARPSP